MDSIFSLTEQQAPSTLYCLMLSLSVFSPLTQIWFIPTISIQSAFIKSFLFSSFISFHCTINSEFDLSFYQPGLIDLCWTIRLPQRRKWKKQPCCDADGWSICGSDSVNSLKLLWTLPQGFGWIQASFVKKGSGIWFLGWKGSELSLFTFDLQVQPIISNCPLLVHGFKHIK